MNNVRTAPALAQRTLGQRLAAGVTGTLLSTLLLGSVAIGMTSGAAPAASKSVATNTTSARV